MPFKIKGAAQAKLKSFYETTLFFEKRSSIDTTKQLIISGRGNYGLKPDEGKITDTIGNILLASDSNVTKYNIVLETHKESGYTN